MMRWLPLTAALSSLLLLSACTVKMGEDEAYENSQITPTLEMPPNIIRRKADKNLALPGSKVGTDENVGRYVDTGDLNVAARSLPSVDGVRIEGQGNQYWLHVPQAPRDVYALVREFWLGEGFEFAQDEPIMGLLRTTWVSVRAGNTDGFLDGLLEGMRAADFQYQYSTRIESVDGDSASNIYIAHREQERHLLKNTLSSSDVEAQLWVFREPDPAREVEYLSRLMLFMGMRDDVVKQQLTRIPALPNRTLLVRGDEDTPPFLSVQQNFEQVWNRLRYHLEQRDVKVLDSQRDGLEASLVVDANSFYELVEGAAGPQRETLKFELKGHANAELTLVGLIDDSGSRDKSAQALTLLQSLTVLLR